MDKIAFWIPSQGCPQETDFSSLQGRDHTHNSGRDFIRSSGSWQERS